MQLGGPQAMRQRLRKTKVVLRCKDEHEMDALRRTALADGVPVHSIADAGRTQVPAGSRTVLAVGPAAGTKVDQVTGRLKLY